MFPYWILFTYFAAGAVRSTRGRLRLEGVGWLPLIVGFLGIAVMIGIRYRVGGDWYAYQRMLNNMEWLDFRGALASGDPGYMAVNWVISRLGLGVWGVNLVCGLIFSWGLMRFAANQPNPWLVTVVAIPYLVIVVAMGYTRQAVALGFIMAGLAEIHRAPLWRFVMWTTVAVTFHKSAILILPMVALSRQQSRLVTALVLLGAGAALYYLFVRSAMDTLVTNYIDAEYESEGAGIRVAMNAPPALLFFLFQKRFGFTDEERRLWRNFALGALVALVLILVVSSSTAVDRMAVDLIPLQLVVFGRLPDAIGRGRTSGLGIVAVLFYSAAVQFVWLNYATHSDDWVPYRVFPFGEDVSYTPF